MKSRLSKTSHTFNALNTLAADRPTNITNPTAVLFLLLHDITCKPNKFFIVLEVYKLADMDNAKVSNLNANECRTDGSESKYVENVRIQKGERKLCQLLMAGATLIAFAGNLPYG